jgi:F0F1-type ATP synthase alpha subunit
VAVLLAATSGILDSVPLEEIAESKRAIQKAFSERLPELGRRILAAERLNPGDREAILEVCKDVLKK